MRGVTQWWDKRTGNTCDRCHRGSLLTVEQTCSTPAKTASYKRQRKPPTQLPFLAGAY